MSGGFFDAFLAKVDAAADVGVEFSTYLGGSDNERAHGVAVDNRGSAYVVGDTFSTDFPVTSGALQPTFGGGSYDAFVAKLTTPQLRILSISTARLSFARQQISTTSPPATVSLRNVGEAPVSLGELSVSGDFGVTSECASTLAPGEDCTLEVTFAPTAPGRRAGAVTIPSDGQGSPYVVRLSGSGIAPVMRLSREVVVFAGQAVGTASAAEKITLTNFGSAPLALSGITTAGDFTATNDCEDSLPAGANCTIRVTFVPAGPGLRSGSLTVTDGLPQDVRSASLFGRGLDSSVSASPSRRKSRQGNRPRSSSHLCPRAASARP
jgi:hypothetical protein